MSAKSEELVQTARKLFARYGIRRVNIEEICTEAHVSKMTFYKYFKNKDAIAIRVIDDMADESMRHINDILASGSSIEDRIERLILYRVNSAQETSVELSNDLSDIDSAPGRHLVKRRQEWDHTVRKFYVDAINKGELRSDIDIDFLMYMIQRIREMVLDPELQKIQPDYSQLVRELMNIFYYGILGRRQ
jgi:AcrR family transcriptional regulator